MAGIFRPGKQSALPQKGSGASSRPSANPAKKLAFQMAVTGPELICFRTAIVSWQHRWELTQMQIAGLYLITAAVFLVLDAIMLKTVMKPLFERRLGDWLLDEIRMNPAIVFYLFYVAGVLWFVSLPALRAGMPANALISGALLGAMAYGTYEFTNFATLRAWSVQMVIVDVTWGAILTGFSAWAGVMLTRAFS